MNTLFNEKNRKTTLVLLLTGVTLISLALIMGIADNLPGIMLLYSGCISLITLFTRQWRTIKNFFLLFVFSIIGLIGFSILHNVLYALKILAGDINLLSDNFEILSVTTFLIAVLLCPPGILVGGAGSLIYYFKKRTE